MIKINASLKVTDNYDPYKQAEIINTIELEDEQELLECKNKLIESIDKFFPNLRYTIQYRRNPEEYTIEFRL